MGIQLKREREGEREREREIYNVEERVKKRKWEIKKRNDWRIFHYRHTDSKTDICMCASVLKMTKYKQDLTNFPLILFICDLS